jgi:hypothetical protein
MSYLFTAPEILTSAANDVAIIGSAISTASANAAAPTTGVMTAAADEVSAATAQLFGAFGRAYHTVVSQASAFHSEFTQALVAAASSYAQTEAAGSALLSNELSGQTPTAGSGASASMSASASAGPLEALIMGYTGTAVPSPRYLAAISNAFIGPRFSPTLVQGLITAEQFWPVTPNLGVMTFDESLARGIPVLHNAITAQLGDPVNSAVVFGYSQSATIATDEINALMAASSPYQGQLSFVLAGDPNNPVGGILERFPGFYIPFLDVAFNGATPPNSPYPTVIFTAQYDGIADFPQHPLNLISDLNAFMGYFYVHDTYPLMTPDQVANAVLLPTSPGYTGDTQYYMVMTQNLPLLQPIRDIPYVGPPLADLFQPDLRVLVDLGYADYGPGGNYADIPTPAGLFSVPNPFTVIPDLALGAVQGPYGAAVDIGVEAGLVSPSMYPNTYPWVPSIAPHLNLPMPQSSTTLLSVLSGAAGDVLHVIPPVLN